MQYCTISSVQHTNTAASVFKFLFVFFLSEYSWKHDTVNDNPVSDKSENTCKPCQTLAFSWNAILGTIFCGFLRSFEVPAILLYSKNTRFSYKTFATTIAELF